MGAVTSQSVTDLVPPPTISMHSNAPQTLVELLQLRAAEAGETAAFTLLSEHGPESLGYAELDRRARSVAIALTDAGLSGERVLLLYPPGLEYIIGFFGCLYAGAVAVPAFPPDPARLSRTLPRLHAVVADAGARGALATQDICSVAEAAFGESDALSRLRWLASEEATTDPSQFFGPKLDPTELAFLQYTSGSTASPKGVMLSHRNLLANLECIRQRFGADRTTEAVSWLPPYHDMGLIGCILQPIYVGCHATLMSPVTFLQRPLSWLEAISGKRGVVSGGPNFAYEFCVRKIPEAHRQGLDLSGWELAFCGAEPVRSETIERFVATFGAHGFSPSAFFPCYGLAEATLAVTTSTRGLPPLVHGFSREELSTGRAIEPSSDPTTSQALVGCGTAAEGFELLIVDPESRTRVEPGNIGEIWLAGDSVSRGYWQRPDETEVTFGARLADGEGPYLRTGDMGFVDPDGELYVSGRLKDVIILRGKKFFPQDVEHAAEQSHADLRKGCAAAFVIEDGGEDRLAVAIEVLPTATEVEVITQAIVGAVAEQLGLRVRMVALLRPGALPKTSSGKVRRQACRQELLANTLDVVHQFTVDGAGRPWVPTTNTEAPPTHRQDPNELAEWLRRRVGKRLGLPAEDINPSTPLTSYGIDSLQSVELQYEVQERLGVRLGMGNVLRGASLKELALVLAHSASRRQTMPPPGSGAIPRDLLTADQHRLWLLEHIQPGDPARHVPLAVRIQGELDADALARALELCVLRHEPLRTTFSERDGRPVCMVHDGATVRLERTDLTSVPEPSRGAALSAIQNDEVKAPFDLGTGPLLRARLVRVANDDHHLILTAHHIIADLWSLGLLVRELDIRLREAELPSIRRFRDVAGAERVRLAQPEFTAVLSHWRQRLRGLQELELPYDRPRPRRPTTQGDEVRFTLPTALVERLGEIATGEGATLFMLLLAALKAELSVLVGASDVAVATACHGRFEIGTRDTFGPFSYPLLVRTDMGGDPEFLEALGRVRTEALSAYDNQEAPFAVVARIAAEAGAALPQVMFSVLNHALVPPQLGDNRISLADTYTRATDFDVFFTLLASEGKLQGSVTYRTQIFDRATIQALVSGFIEVLTRAAEQPKARLSTLVPSLASARNSNTEVPPAPSTDYIVALLSTFTADPILESLEFWAREVDVPFATRLAPQAQVFQELAAPTMLVGENERGANVFLIRLEDWLGQTGDARASLARNLSDFTRGIRAAAASGKAPFLVHVCPTSDRVASDPKLSTLLREGEATLLRELQALPRIHVEGSLDTAELGLWEIDDEHGESLAQIPYVPAVYAALGTRVARSIHCLLQQPMKVLVLDCDNTLWSGICAEDGADGVVIDAARVALQRFALAQRQAGMLLALASKNDEPDVWRVFDQRPEMVLHREHVSAWRIDWKPKSETIRELAEELGLGLDSVVLFDDSPVECAEVRERLPQVAVVQLPTDAAALPRLLQHLWLFDRGSVTDEDRQRAERYRQESARARLEKAAPSLEDFIAELELTVKIRRPKPNDLARASQLTLRTNQFNVTGTRRDEGELSRTLAATDTDSFLVDVSDRFGSYGDVGYALTRDVAGELVVDTFVLSCRALGRGIEHRMLAHLGELAKERNLSHVRLTAKPSGRNGLALAFARELQRETTPSDGDVVVELTAAEAASTRFRAPTRPRSSEGAREFTPPVRATDKARERARRIASFSRDPDALLLELERQRRTHAKSRETEATPLASDTEHKVAAVFKDVLGVESVGANDSFFALGGTSLLAMRILSRLRKEIGIDVEPDALLDGDITISELGQRIDHLVAQSDQALLESTLDRVSSLTDAEVARMLEETDSAGE